MFTELKLYDELPRRLLEPEVSGKQWERKEYRSSAKAPKQQTPGRWQVTQLPPGFEKDVHVRHGRGGDSRGEHLVFSDGLASVSVFIETADEDADRLSGLSHMGAIHAFGRKTDGHRVIVVGEVPAETVKLIAEGVRPAGSGTGD